MSELFNFKVPQGGVLGEDLNQSVGDQVFQELGRMHSSSSFGAGTLSQHSSGSAENPNTGDEEKENVSVNQLTTEMKAVSINVSNGPTDSSDLGRLAMFGPQKKPQLRRSQISKEESKEDAPKRASTIPSRRSHLPTSTNTSQQRRSQLIPSKSVAKEDTTRIIAKPQGRRSQLPPRPSTRSLPQPSGGPLRVLPPKANPAPARPITRAFAKAQSNGTGTPKVAQSPARSRDRAPKHTPSSQTNRAVSSLPVKVGRDISNSRPVEQREFMRSVTRRDGSVDSVKRGPEPKPFMSGLRAYPSSIVKATTPRPATVAKSPRFSSRERTSRGLSPIAPRLPVNATPKRTEEVRHVPISAERISAMVARLSQPRRSHVDMPQKAPTNTSRVLTTPLKTGRDGRAEREGTHGMRVGKPMVRSRSNSVLRQNGN